MTNDLHEEPFGLLEDVFVDESERGSGARHRTRARSSRRRARSRASRPKVHDLYERLGFENYGIEFRMSLAAKA